MTDLLTTPLPATASIGPRGFGGWLVIPILGLIITPPFALYSLGTTVVPLFEAAVRQAVFARPPLLLMVGVELVGSFVMLVLSAICLVRSKQRSSKFPSLMITFLCVNFVVHLSNAATTIWYYDSIGMSPPSGAGQGGFGTLLAVLVWVPYFIKSKRVKNTFVK